MPAPHVNVSEDPMTQMSFGVRELVHRERLKSMATRWVAVAAAPGGESKTRVRSQSSTDRVEKEVLEEARSNVAIEL